MNYEQAKSRALYFQIIGNVIFLICVLAVIVSLLKGLYFHFDSTPLFSGVSKAIKVFVTYIYQNTQALSVLWKYSPVPNMISPFEISNLWFALIYFPMFIGASLVRYGKKISKIIKKVDAHMFEQHLIGKEKSKHEIKVMRIPVSSFSASQFHTLYVAPFVVAFLIYLLQKYWG